MTESAQKTLSVVVPFLNEEGNLPTLYERLIKAMTDQPEALDVLFVDDGSTDGSPAWAADLARRDARVKLLRLSRNFGHQIAITAGMDHAKGDAVVIIDADLQDPPETIPEMLARWREGYDVVYAVRRTREGEGFFKKLFAATFYRVFHRMANIEVPMDAGDFRLVDRRVVAALREVRELHRFMRGLTCWVGFKQCAVYYERAARLAGSTKYPVWKSARLAWDAITSFSGTPLRWVTATGFVVAAAGLLLIARIIVARWLHPEGFERGWATLVALVVFLGGLQLGAIGLVGQYVSQIFEESKKRPLYFLREIVAKD